MDVVGVDDPLLNQVNQILRQNPGDCALFINLRTPENHRRLIRSKNLKVRPSQAVIEKLRSLLGQDNVWMEEEKEKEKINGLKNSQERR
jgi:hypothetical protein